MNAQDQPDPIYPAVLIYREFKNKLTGQNGHPVPLYQVHDERTGGIMTITKEAYFREVLKRKVALKHHVQE